MLQDNLKKNVARITGPLRWPNTVFARALADTIQRAHKDCKNKHSVDTAIILFAQYPLYLCYLFVIERSVLMTLDFYNKGMLEKLTTQRTRQFSDFSKSKEPS